MSRTALKKNVARQHTTHSNSGCTTATTHNAQQILRNAYTQTQTPQNYATHRTTKPAQSTRTQTYCNRNNNGSRSNVTRLFLSRTRREALGVMCVCLRCNTIGNKTSVERRLTASRSKQKGTRFKRNTTGARYQRDRTYEDHVLSTQFRPQTQPDEQNQCNKIQNSLP